MISVVIRTFNEEKHLGQLIDGIESQNTDLPVEIIVVDSGSTDASSEIALKRHCRLLTIKKSDFTFGRSLNLGCDAAHGEYLVFISGHCIPYDEEWLSKLIAPLRSGEAEYAYGRQTGGLETRFSEQRIFNKYFPKDKALSPGGYFCSNANAALLKSIFSQYRFDEDLTGLEDMELAKRIMFAGKSLAYVDDATVYHIHDETWRKIERRYEREAIALQHIMPEIHIHFTDFIRFFLSAVNLDLRQAAQQKLLMEKFSEIILFRFMQYFGSYRGNQMHRQLSRRRMERYFYPDVRDHDPQDQGGQKSLTTSHTPTS